MTPRTDRRAMAALYASLTPVERSRLIARAWREHTGEIDAIRDAIPDSHAGHAYNRAIGILRELHDATPAMLLALTFGIEKWTLLASIAYDVAAAPRVLLAYLHRLWRLFGYPVTESEHHRLRDLERSEPMDVEDHLLNVCLNGDADDPRIHPDLAAIARERSDDPSDDETADITKRAMCVLRAAVRAGDLPKPTKRQGETWLPYGVLSDWAHGTTPETYQTFGPDYHIPEIGFFGGGLAAWDIRPDAEAESVQERRAELLTVLGSIARDGGNVEPSILAGMTLEPPKTVAEREQRYAVVEDVWPWAMGEDLRDELRGIAVPLRALRTELRAYMTAMERMQETEFGGEDPLDPRVRDVLDRAARSDDAAVELWAHITNRVKPWRDDAADWPPSLDDDASFADLVPRIERLLRDEWAA